jgi:hypothetical protein
MIRQRFVVQKLNILFGIKRYSVRLVQQQAFRAFDLSYFERRVLLLQLYRVFAAKPQQHS